VLLNQNAFAVDEHIAYFPAGGGAATVVTHTIPANSRGTIDSWQLESNGTLAAGTYSAQGALSSDAGGSTPP